MALRARSPQGGRITPGRPALAAALDILALLEKSNLFLIPLDSQRQWFRYHHLFADLLQVRLRLPRVLGIIPSLGDTGPSSLSPKGIALLRETVGFNKLITTDALSMQAIGWHPDLNDGVRTNIRPFLAQDIPGGKKGAGILRAKPNIKWEKDRGKEPVRDKAEYPWFWGWDEEAQDFAGVGKGPNGNRWNDCHYSIAV